MHITDYNVYGNLRMTNDYVIGIQHVIVVYRINVLLELEHACAGNILHD